MKKFGLVLVLLMAAAIAFAGGGAQSGAPAVRPAGMTASGYPIVTDGSVALRYWTPINATVARFIQSYAENTAYQEMERLTGIRIEWVHPATGMEQEQFNLLMASGDLPDIISSTNLYRGGEFQGMYDGLFMDLTDQLPGFAPYYWNLVQEDEEFFRLISDDDGRIPAFYAYKPYGDPPFTRVILRTDVLSDINQQIPRLISDYDTMFARMLANGIIPFMPPANGMARQFVGAYGVIPGFYRDTNGRVQFGQVAPGFRQYLEMMQRWYAAGFISRDFTSLNVNQVNTLFDTRQIGMQLGPIVANFNRNRTLGFEVTSAPYPRLTPGQQLHHEDTNIWPLQGRGTQMASVSARSRNAEAAIRWLDYGYTPSGFVLMNWGVEGINFNVINGERVYNDLMFNNPRFGTEEASYIYKMHFAPKIAEFDVVAHANLLMSPESLASRFLWADDPNVDSSLNLPPFQLNTTEQNLRTRVLTEIQTYSDEMILLFITGAEPLSRWDAYVQMINNMGLPALLASEQAAYERYLAKRLR